MPNPQEVATVVANGMTYNYFELIQIERRYDDVISHMRLQVAGNSSGSVGGAAPELMPLASAQGYLGGVPVISGQVCIRQAQYDKDAHTVLIVVASATQNLAASDGRRQPRALIRTIHFSRPPTRSRTRSASTSLWVGERRRRRRRFSAGCRTYWRNALPVHRASRRDAEFVSDR